MAGAPTGKRLRTTLRGMGDARRPPLVGRQAELAALHDVLSEAERGRGSVVVIEGEAGIGKTRLLEEAVAVALTSRFIVRRAASEELERVLPFGVMVNALRGGATDGDRRLGAVDDLLAGRRAEEASPLSGGGGKIRYRVVEEVLALIEELALEKPVLIVLEDLHWADPSSLLAVRALARRAVPLRIVLMCSLRPFPRTGELSAALDALRSEGATFLRLQPLDDEEAVALVGSIVDLDRSERLGELAARAGGNPLFLVELGGALIAGALSADQAATPGAIPLPRSLREAILNRYRAFSDETFRVLQMGAVLGSSFEVADLATCLNRSPMEVLPPLEEAERAGVVTSRGGARALPTRPPAGRALRGDRSGRPPRAPPRCSEGARGSGASR
jgi:predicted ATPase